jgi:hypothetical protein
MDKSLIVYAIRLFRHFQIAEGKTNIFLFEYTIK